MTSGSVKGIEIHDRREKDGVSHTNKDIDWSKAKLNYDLHPQHNANFNAAVKNRINQLQLRRAVRKDAIVMAQVLVTSDSGFFSRLSLEQQRQFFTDSYNFLADRYGRENVISATVHLDERTPHMHFNFVPITADGRLSAKSVLTRQSLIQQQDDFISSVGGKYGLERGTHSEEKKEHLETAKYKLKTWYAKIDSAEHTYNHLQNDVSKIRDEIKDAENALEAAQSDLNAVNEKLYAKQKSLSELEMSEKEIESIDLTPKKLTGGFKGLSPDDAHRLFITALSAKQRAEEAEKEKEKEKADEEKNRLYGSVSRLVDENAEKDSKIHFLEDKLSFVLSRLAPSAREKVERAFTQSQNSQQRRKGLSQ